MLMVVGIDADDDATAALEVGQGQVDRRQDPGREVVRCDRLCELCQLLPIALRFEESLCKLEPSLAGKLFQRRSELGLDRVEVE